MIVDTTSVVPDFRVSEKAAWQAIVARLSSWRAQSISRACELARNSIFFEPYAAEAARQQESVGGRRAICSTSSIS
jgi:hypothetical protein